LSLSSALSSGSDSGSLSSIQSCSSSSHLYLIQIPINLKSAEGLNVRTFFIRLKNKQYCKYAWCDQKYHIDF
jgi:hypothetical protein